MKTNKIQMIDKIERIAIGKLRLYERNPKKHPEEQVESIAQKIREVGFLRTILIDDKNEIVAGEGRYLAAQKLGMKMVPCVRSRNLTPEQVRAFRIADNKVAEGGYYDDEALLLEINELMEKGVEIEATGYDEAEVEEMIRGIEEPEKTKKVKGEGRRVKREAGKRPKARHRIMVECRSNKQKEVLLERFQSEGLECWGVG